MLEAFAQLRIVADRPGSDFDGDDLIGGKTACHEDFAHAAFANLFCNS